MIWDKQAEFIINATHDAMVAVDKNGIVTIFNKAAQILVGCPTEDAIGHHINDVIKSTRLPYILETGESELNRQQPLNNTIIITSRMPVLDENRKIIGAVAIFRDISEAIKLAEELTDVKSIQSMLAAVFNATQDAISVVDENGIGILINPAYTRVTGLSEKDVIGKPASIDITEGNSVHLEVLRSKEASKGSIIKVGPGKKEVLVSAAPIIVDGALKGSVGVLHDMTELNALSYELRQAKRIIRNLEAKYSFEDIIGNSEGIVEAVEKASRAAKTPATVLLRGESGTGKEIFAHAIHNASSRKYNQFIKVNCAALTDSLLESELFGYEEGAFTGAKKGGKKGLFEESDKGTIFLDEIGEMSTETQAKLLRVLQEKEIIRVGGTKPIPIDSRVIAATNIDIEQAIALGKFRNDLYYRLNIFPIKIPALREHQEDIPILVNTIIKKINQEYGRSVNGITPGAMEILQGNQWTGNVRELENVIGRAMINMKIGEKSIEEKHLPSDLLKENNTIKRVEDQEEPIEEGTLEQALERVERRFIQHTLENCKGNKTRTAKELKMSIRSLYYKIEKYGLENINKSGTLD